MKINFCFFEFGASIKNEIKAEFSGKKIQFVLLTIRAGALGGLGPNGTGFLSLSVRKSFFKV